MLISAFTPFHQHNTSYLQEAYQSLLEQTYENWEWVLLLNGDGHLADLSFLTDPRVKIHKTFISGNIGALKKEACMRCSGEILCEFDYDDLLTFDCLEEVYLAFLTDDNIQMAYSNACEFHDQTWLPNAYSAYWGWRTRPFTYKDKELIEMISWPPCAQMMRRIEWAPNHIRAWRKSFYIEIGGHDPQLKVGDDHDLCCRFYIKSGEKGIKFIDKCLYLYRVHEKNNVKLLNSEIQAQTDKNYLKYSRELAKRWADDNNLRCIDLGGRFDCPEGYESVDLSEADIICDLNGRWNFKDNSIGVIRASHVLEHLENPIHVMNEAYRVLAGGGFFFIDVPSTDGRGAFQDPTHRTTFWNQNSFFYYSRSSHAKYIQGKHLKPSYNGRFQIARICTWFPNSFFKENDIPCVQADLISLKSPYDERWCGEKLI